MSYAPGNDYDPSSLEAHLPATPPSIPTLTPQCRLQAPGGRAELQAPIGEPGWQNLQVQGLSSRWAFRVGGFCLEGLMER